MHFAVKKAENCFSDAENYQYRIEISGAEFVDLLKSTSSCLETSVNEEAAPVDFASAETVSQGMLTQNRLRSGMAPSTEKALRCNPSAKIPVEALKTPVLDYLRVNEKLRRPTFIARLTNGVQLKGLLGKNIIKLGFVPEQATEQKTSFESWLHTL